MQLTCTSLLTLLKARSVRALKLLTLRVIPKTAGMVLSLGLGRIVMGSIVLDRVLGKVLDRVLGRDVDSTVLEHRVLGRARSMGSMDCDHSSSLRATSLRQPSQLATRPNVRFSS